MLIPRTLRRISSFTRSLTTARRDLKTRRRGGRHPDCKGCFGGRAARCDLGTVMCTAFEVWPQATGIDAVR